MSAYWQAKRTSWAAVSVVPKSSSCAAAQSLKEVRVLCEQAVMLPLPGCTKPDQCRCVFRKHTDRREGPRREEDETGVRRFIQPNAEKRMLRGRRAGDHEVRRQ